MDEMTAKRFRFNGMTNCIEYDNESILLDSYGEDIAELLNELHEENQELKQQLQSILKLTKRIEDCTHDIKMIGDGE